jgi:hypothetical protein
MSLRTLKHVDGIRAEIERSRSERILMGDIIDDDDIQFLD